MKATVWVVAAAALWCAGCASAPTLPVVPESVVGNRLPALSPGAAPVYEWTAQTDVVFSFWGRQQFAVAARAAFPEGDEFPDGCWSLEVRSLKGTAIQSIGIERRYTTPEGRPASVLYPEIDFYTVPDGLYTILLPGVTRKEGKVISVAPTVVLCELRGHTLRPFRYPIPLVPTRPDPLTPAPPPPPPKPAGTPIPITPGR